MRAAVTAFQEVSRTAGVQGAALVGVAREVLTHGVETDADALWSMAGAARTIFRETQPPLRLLDLSFPAVRVAIVPAGDVILVIRSLGGGAMAEILSVVWPRVPALGTFASGPPPGPPAETPPAPLLEGAAATLAALNLVVAAMRKHIGGAVIRNYLRKSQAALLGEHPALGGLCIGLSGEVTAAGEGAEGPALAASAGAWLDHALARAATVAPDLASLDVASLALALAPHLGKNPPR